MTERVDTETSAEGGGVVLALVAQTPRACELPEGVAGRIGAILAALDRSFAEREVEARVVLLAVLAGHHVLLLGPPGTGKSLLARAVCGALSREGGEPARYFEYLLTRFSHPDELFGPLSIPGLKEEDYRRVTEGYLPEAEIAFVDEIFKANSAILNSLLGIVNERIFHCGRRRERVPLVAMIGASNEPPDPEGGLGALFDRFLVRLSVTPVEADERFLAVALGEVPVFSVAPEERVSMAEVEAIRAEASRVAVGEEVRAALLTVRRMLAAEGIEASDRRWRWAVELLRVAALTSGRSAVGGGELVLLQHVFGEPGEDGGRVRQVIKRALEGWAEAAAVGRLGARGATVEALSERWQALAEAEREDGARTLRELRLMRLTAIDLFEGEVMAALGALDEARDRALEEVRASPWLAGGAGGADVMARLVTAFLGARQGFERLLEVARGHRAELGGVDLHGEVLERLKRVQSQTVGHERRAFGADDVAIWLAADAEEPDHWVPVSTEGWLLHEAAPRIAGRLQRGLLDEALAERRSLDEALPWHAVVERLVLDDEATWALLSEWGELRAFLERRGIEAKSRGGLALRALSEWLRGAGVPRLPPVPTLPGLG